MKQYPSQERLREIFNYDSDEGLTWKRGPWEGRSVGVPTINANGYAVNLFILKGRQYRYDDILWIFFYGEIPAGKFVKSRSGSFSTSHPSDLYLSQSKHRTNAGKIIIKNKNGYKGVIKTSSGLYKAELDSRHLGTYSTLEAAASAYDAESEKVFGRGSTKNNSGCEDPEKFRVTYADQNQRRKSKTGRYKGVMPRNEKWYARIKVNGKQIYLGTFKDQESAARAYNIAAHKRYGDSAALNDIPDPLGKGDVF